MYEALNEFLDEPSWHTFHSFDQRRFYVALDRLIRNPNFDVISMGQFIRKRGIEEGIYQSVLDGAVERCTDAATHVRDYLLATGSIHR